MNRIEDIMGYVKVVNQIPTQAPKTYYDSILIYLDNYTSPTTKRLYIFAREAKTWYYINLT